MLRSHSRAAVFAVLAVRALPLTLVATSIQAAESVPILSTISISPNHSSNELDTAASTGSALNLTPLQTPASISIITREQLEQYGDSNLSDTISRSVGLSSIGHPGNGGAALSARGFTGSSSVMQLYDGKRQYGGIGITFPFDTWSIDRIEVLRGPASVIYGEGAIGGVVNVIPKKPARGPIENELQATIGSDNTQRLGVGSGGAINDKLSYRFDASGNRSDGWVDMGDSRNLTFSGALQLDVSPEFSLTLSYAQGLQEPMRYFGSPLINGELDDALRKQNYNVNDATIKYDDRWTELSAQWRPNDTTTIQSRLYQIDSDRHWRNAEYYDYVPASGLIKRSSYTEIKHAQSQVGNTTDISFDTHVLGMKNQVSIGFDVNQSTFKHTNNAPYSGVSLVNPYGFDRGEFINTAGTAPRYRNKASQYSLFAENRLEITPAWSVLAGLRYDHAHVTRRDLIIEQTVLDKTFSNVGWRLGSVYEILPGLAIYGQYSQAADPVSALLMMPPANKDFDLSTGKQFEIGAKQTFWDNKGEWTLAAYRIVKEKLLTRDSSNPAVSVQVGQQSSQGLEATLGMEFAPGWRVDANAAILRARYDDFSESVNGVAVSRNGNTPTDVPERLANLWLSWRFLPGWTASTGLRYVGKRYADRANTLKLPAYTTTDLALQWQPKRDLTLTLRGFNVFDKHYAETAYYNQTQWFQGPGR
ncbi:MAG TPA: TonB-dependent receptor, partial [Candidimonas sp.]|nr:TonB-dependent receptor [Candidimonas sp.]